MGFYATKKVLLARSDQVSLCVENSATFDLLSYSTSTIKQLFCLLGQLDETSSIGFSNGQSTVNEDNGWRTFFI